MQSQIIHPNGVNHVVISTLDLKAQLEFWTDVMGGQLKGLHEMHGVKGVLLAWVEFSSSPPCYINLQFNPKNPSEIQLGLTHSGTAVGPSAIGTMHHLALNINELDELYAMRDRLRSKGVPVLGPMNHGMCHSIYFAGPEGLALEIACGKAIDAEEWVDPESVKQAGISKEELGRYLKPEAHKRPSKPVPQPGPDAKGPHMMYPRKVYEKMLRVSDEDMLNSVESEPPVKKARL